ncbi:hypothetical protein GKO28_04735 [Deefgea sp. CFH1-16]|nr:hypothetical protein [Deefgea sp. CFH1-16]
MARSYAIPDDEQEPTLDDVPYEIPSVLRSNRAPKASTIRNDPPMK